MESSNFQNFLFVIFVSHLINASTTFETKGYIALLQILNKNLFSFSASVFIISPFVFITLAFVYIISAFVYII